MILLREEADVIADGEKALEQLSCLGLSALEQVVVAEPEGAGQEGALAWREAVVGERGVVAVDEAVDEEALLDEAHGPAHALVRRGEEADERHEEETRVHLLRAIRLHERADRWVERALADLRMQLAA